MIGGVKGLQLFVLGSESALGSCVYHQQYLPGIVAQHHGVACAVQHAELVNVVHRGGFGHFGFFLIAGSQHHHAGHENNKCLDVFHFLCI